MNGFIFLWKKIEEWEWYRDLPTFKLFIHLLINAYYQDTNWRNIAIKRGQVVSSIENLAVNCGLSVKQTRRAIDNLISTGEIITKGTNKFTIITICKYEGYQTQNTNSGQTKVQTEVTTKVTTKGTYINNIINKEDNKDSIIYTATENFETAENENQNNGTINEKKEKEKSCAKKEKAKKFNPMEFIKNEPAESRELLERWLNYKQTEFGKSYKTEGSFKAFINRLNDLSGGNFETAKAIIEQSIANCYQGIFELKKQYQNGNTNNQISMQRIFEASEAMREYEQQLFGR